VRERRSLAAVRCRSVGLALALLVAVGVVGATAEAAGAAACPAANPSYTGPCGPTFTVPTWGNAGGWKSPDQYSTIQLADVLGNGRDQLIARSAAGIEIYQFDTSVGQWRPEVDANGVPVVLSGFADPPPLSTAHPSYTGTDWTLPQYYSTIQAADINGNGRDDILARAKTGMIVFQYNPGANGAPGTWQQLTGSGPFSDADGFSDPSAYSTIQTADIIGDGHAELIGRSPTDGLEMWRWNGSGWDRLAGIPALKGSLDPSVYTTIQTANPEGTKGEEVWYRSTAGLVGYRYVNGNWQTVDQHQTEPMFPNTSSGGVVQYNTKWETSPSYYDTIQFANLTGGPAQQLVARNSMGEFAFTLTSHGWQRLGNRIASMSDADGWTQAKYWQTIRFADIDGSGKDTLLARGPQGLVAYKLAGAASPWEQLQPKSALQLADDPWGSDPSYYTTIEVGDITGSGHDAVIARGPYGIRTWFYNRPGVDGWSAYLPSGYPAFSTAGQQAAYAALNAQASAQGLITGDEHAIRDVWSGENAPAASDLAALQGGLISVGKCSNETGLSPPQYQSCSPPAGSSGFTAADWTGVLNEMFSELFDAEQVVSFFGQLNSIRQSMFLAQGAELPAIGSQLQLAAAANTPASFNLPGLYSGIFGIAASVAGVSQPELSAALWVAAEVFSMIPSATPDLTDSVTESYSALQGTFATAVTEADKGLASESQDVRSDLGLLTLVGQLRHLGTWKLDAIGMESAGREGFALWVYKALLPLIWARYNITRCVTPNTFNVCNAPPAGPWVIPQPNNGFESIGPPPGSNPPCSKQQTGFHPVTWQTTCNFAAPPANIANILWGQLSPSCAYQPGNANTAWTYGCGLGVDPLDSVDQNAKIGSVKEYWNFPTYTGNPCITLTCNGSGAQADQAIDASADGASTLASMAGTARGVGLASASIQLSGGIGLPHSINLSHATVVLNRVLYDPSGTGELVRLLPVAHAARAAAIGPSATPALGSVTLHNAGNGSFDAPRFALRGMSPPSISLRLAQRADNALAFTLAVSNVALPVLPAACGVSTRRLLLTPPPVPLNLQLSVLQAGEPRLTISLTPSFACRRDQLGTVRTLTLVQPSGGPKLGPPLSITTRGSHRLSTGQHGTFTATVHNRTRTTAYNVFIRALAPAGFRVIGHTPGARVSHSVLVWQLTTLAPQHSRAIRLTVVPTQTVSARRCTTIAAQATLRRPASGTTCTAVTAPQPPTSGRG
jgi:Domain of unknown function DUF11